LKKVKKTVGGLSIIKMGVFIGKVNIEIMLDMEGELFIGMVAEGK